MQRFIQALAALIAVSTPPANAQSYPVKPVRWVLPFAAGGSTDILARQLGQRITESLGQPVVIENRGGAGGNIGAELVARAAPDGYTFMVTTSGVITVNRHLHRKLPFDPQRDFAPVSLIVHVPNLLVVHPSVPARSVKELIALARARPDALNYGSGGNGTSNHLASELFNSMAGVKIAHIPYKGGGPAVAAILGGEVGVLFAVIPSAIGHVQSGRLRALAISTAKRSAAVPDIPTVAESGVPGFEVSIWQGAFAPAATPRELIQRMHAEIARAVRLPDLRERLLRDGFDPVGSSPEELDAVIRAEAPRWAKVVSAAGLRPE